MMSIAYSSKECRFAPAYADIYLVSNASANRYYGYIQSWISFVSVAKETSLIKTAEYYLETRLTIAVT